jgi:hypothetical protein
MNKAKVFGRIVGLSTVFATLIVIVFYGLAMTRPAVQARAAYESTTTGCTLATIKGNYGSLVIGMSPVVFTQTGIFTPNGAGTFVYTYTSQYDGKIYSATDTGTYTLESNCSGTMTLNDGGNTYTYTSVVVTNGNEIDLMSTTIPSVLTWVSKRIN